MESRAQTAIGLVTLVLGIAAMGIYLDRSDGLGGSLLFAGYALGGLLLATGGIGLTVDVGARTITRSHFLGAACVVFGLSFAPYATEAFSGTIADRAYGVAAGVGAVSLLWIGASYLLGRSEPVT